MSREEKRKLLAKKLGISAEGRSLRELEAMADRKSIGKIKKLKKAKSKKMYGTYGGTRTRT